MSSKQHSEDDAADRRYTVEGAALHGLVRYARSRGVDPTPLLAAEGLELPSSAEARVAQGPYNRLFDVIAAVSGDEDFGLHYAERLDVDAFGVVGHLARKSATLGDAFDQIEAFSRLLHDSGQLVVERRGDEALVHPGCYGALHQTPRHVAEFSVAAVVVLARKLTGQPVKPLRVSLRHDAPAARGEHVRIFGLAPRFRQPETTVVFPSSALSLPIMGAEPALVRHLEAWAEELLRRLPGEPDGVGASVRRCVMAALEAGEPLVMERMARQLGMSERTLQRKLAAEGLSFTAIVDELRYALAERYLAMPALSLQEVSARSGFADPSNLHRALRRWTGMTPAQLRRALTDRAAATS